MTSQDDTPTIPSWPSDPPPRRPNERSGRRVGSFGDGLARAGVYRATLRRVDSPRRPVEERRAA
jgi:hypothetical protein